MKTELETVVMLPCPFCGSSNIRECEMMFLDDDGEHPGVECLDCDASNRQEYWNMRHADAAISTMLRCFVHSPLHKERDVRASRRRRTLCNCYGAEVLNGIAGKM